MNLLSVLRRRAFSAKAFVAVAVIAASLLPASAAKAEPQIHWLNPSQSTLVGDKQDADTAYHFVAWVGDVPANPLVEFELRMGGGNAHGFDATRVGSSDTWESFFTIPDELSDGNYTLTARLFSGITEVGNATRSVTIARDEFIPILLPAVETVEILHPENVGHLGFFTPSGGGNPTTIIDAQASSGARFVRFFYTTSAPGTDPEWTSCGNSTKPGDGFVRHRCTLADEVQPATVTAVAATANVTPSPAPADSSFDDSGDAHRVQPYTAQVADLSIDPGSATQDVGVCRHFTATVTDQRGRPLPAVNVDVHAWGPDNNLRFGSGGGSNAFQPPDSNHTAQNEAAWNCGTNASGGLQGEHNRPGAPDIKHIESAGDGTTNNGTFVFALRSAQQNGGVTHIEAWADLNDDDLKQIAEPSAGAQLGWAQDAPPPFREVVLDPAQSSVLQGDCQRIVAQAKQGGTGHAGVNMDVHITGPDSTVQFCTVEGGSTLRDPDSGDHVGNVHSDGAKHAEGEAGPNGVLVFGVRSLTEGTTAIEVWVDDNDDDILNPGEPVSLGQASWLTSGDRRINNFRSNKKAARKGGRAKLIGRIRGPSAGCVANQQVRIRAKRPGGNWNRLKTIRTNNNGRFQTRVRIPRTRVYQAVAPVNGPCVRAPSSQVRIRAKN